MKIYLISQDVNNDYDTYDSAVVVAEDEEAARMTHPLYDRWDGVSPRYGNWPNSEHVKVEFLAETNETEARVILASFNAG